MEWQGLIELSAHAVTMLVLLIVAMTAIRTIAGGPLFFAEIGVALLIALAYRRVVGWAGAAPRWRMD